MRAKVQIECKICKRNYYNNKVAALKDTNVKRCTNVSCRSLLNELNFFSARANSGQFLQFTNIEHAHFASSICVRETDKRLFLVIRTMNRQFSVAFVHCCESVREKGTWCLASKQFLNGYRELEVFFLGTGTFLEQSNVWDFNPSPATRSYDLQYVTTMKRERLEIDSKNQYKLWMRSFGWQLEFNNHTVVAPSPRLHGHHGQILLSFIW